MESIRLLLQLITLIIFVNKNENEITVFNKC